MKVKDLKIGSLYVLCDRFKTIHTAKVSDFRNHYGLSASEVRRTRYPIGIEYLHITNDFSWNNNTNTKYPIMYLGTTTEKWWCNRADWFPIKKRHWCMYKSRRMILDAWSAKHLKFLGGENEQL